MNFRQLSLQGFLLVTIASATFAQTLPVLHSNTENIPTAGIGSLGLGDIDGDGQGDYGLVYGGAGPIFGGNVFLYSGASGNLIESYPLPTTPASSFVRGLGSCGDLDGDGHAEYILRHVDSTLLPVPATARGTVYSGATLLPLFNLDIGASSSFFIFASRALDDLNGDGHREIGIAWRDQLSPVTGSGTIAVYSGSDGSVLRSVSSPSLQSNGIGSVGDHDGDGVEDYFLGITEGQSIALGPYCPGVIEIRSGATGALIRSISGTAPYLGVGMFSSPVEDLDGDGRPDIVTMSLNSLSLVPEQDERIEAYSSATGAVIWSVAGLTFGNLSFIQPIGDVNGDGIGDQVAANSISRFVISGADGSLLEDLSLSPGLRSDGFVGDVNGDGMSDRLQVSQPSLPSTTTTVHTSIGSLTYAGNSATSLDFVFDHNVSQPRVGAYAISGATPAATVFVAASLAPDSGVLAGTSLPRVVSLDPSDLIVINSFVADASGRVRVLGNLQQPALVGTVVYLQAAELNPAMAVSNGVEVLFGN